MSDLLNNESFWTFLGCCVFIIIVGLTILCSMAIYYKNEPYLVQKEIELERLRIELEKAKRKRVFKKQ